MTTLAPIEPQIRLPGKVSGRRSGLMWR